MDVQGELLKPAIVHFLLNRGVLDRDSRLHLLARAWFDRLLAEHGIRDDRIPGYTTEEFTHQAVAAVIAYGAADAGLGARAAADRFGLDFLPVGWERYYLATALSLPEAAFDALAAALAERARVTPGYRPVNSR